MKQKTPRITPRELGLRLSLTKIQGLDNWRQQEGVGDQPNPEQTKGQPTKLKDRQTHCSPYTQKKYLHAEDIQINC